MDDQIFANSLRSGRSRVGTGYERDPVPPRDPARDLAEEVRPGASALRVGPVAVGEQQDVQRAADPPTLPQAHGVRSDHGVPYIGLVIAPRRLLAVLATAALATPAAAQAQGAGDDQYQDPFAGAPKTTKTPPASPTERAQVRQQQGQPSLSQQPPPGAPRAPSATPAAPVATTGSPLPYTGAEIPGMALLGLGLLAVGLGLRLRTADETLF
jgi:hypothetical protein